MKAPLIQELINKHEHLNYSKTLCERSLFELLAKTRDEHCYAEQYTLSKNVHIENF